ncbi:nucleotide exchange factor GrpE [uncultured Helicobacter sp.]|uniref:nucleotide exchange factor GrpE n=1 Tax=uncultured Helicobacter sp. TaxID=175537 RepID=UPI002619C8DA|nr:nucleotide exchange factor GrpE [uncultured Helicobacter sp.]
MQETKNNDINQAQDTCDNAELESSQDSALASGESMESTLDSSAPESNTAGDEPSMLDAAYKELEEKYMRAYADFENVKKRLEREKNQALEYAYEKIAKDLLPILDALDNAKAAAKEHSAILEGIALVQDNFLKILSRHGVEAIDTSGEFDPNLHECIMQVAKPEAQDGHIAQVMQQGYKYKERTLRPAMVAVVKNN